MGRTPQEERIKGYKNLFKYLSYFKKYPFLCIGFWVLLLIGGVISFLAPLVLGQVIAEISSGHLDMAVKYAWIMFALEMTSLIIGLIKVPFFKNLENRVKLDVKLDIIQSTFRINIGEYEKMGNGLFITRLTRDLDSLANSFNSISQTIVSFFSKLGFVVYICYVNIWLGLFLLTFVLIRYFVYKIRIHYYALLKPKVHKKAEIVNSSVGESIRGIKDIKTLDLEPVLLDKIECQQREFIKADNKEWYVGTFAYSLANFINIICNLFFVILCVYLIKSGLIAIAIFYTAYIYKNNVMDFAVHLGNLQDYLKELEVSAFRVFDLKNSEKYKFTSYGEDDYPEFEGNIEFNNVVFNYNSEESVLAGISFKIKKNSHVAFVGESGCGKSTIVSLICKLYDPLSGEILFDNKDSKSLSKNFYKNISMVSQFPYVFNMTIKENLLLAKSDATDEQIWEVLKLANAFEFVTALPNGLDSYLGEGGTRLSGGQKQRICIARTLLKGAKVIIFDEATSSLDNLSQQQVMASVESLQKTKTIITIAHRLSTIEQCSEIFYVENGKIVDSGTHDELMFRNKKYEALYIKQQKEHTSTASED